MFNYLVKISYDGNYFYGWAKQPNLRTIQSGLEKMLTTMFEEEINVVGSGRTDRYVHAHGQYFSFKSTKQLPLDGIKSFLNDRSKHWNVISINLVDKNFSARFNSKLKIYHYKFKLHFEEEQRVFLENYFYLYQNEINYELIEKGIELLIGEKDFASFSAKENYKNTFRKLIEINLIKSEDDLIFEFKGEGFLRYMIRNLVGSLIALNESKLSWEEFVDLIENPQKGKNHYKLKGNALYLKDVIY